jgi:hypothetical protein
VHVHVHVHMHVHVHVHVLVRVRVHVHVCHNADYAKQCVCVRSPCLRTGYLRL